MLYRSRAPQKEEKGDNEGGGTEAIRTKDPHREENDDNKRSGFSGYTDQVTA